MKSLWDESTQLRQRFLLARAAELCRNNIEPAGHLFLTDFVWSVWRIPNSLF